MEVEEAGRFWLSAVEKVFGVFPPMTATWRSPQGIVNILSAFTHAAHTYTLFPEGGGIHLNGAVISKEQGCIELYPSVPIASETAPRPFIINVKTLRYFKPGKDLTWSYFILEADALTSRLHYKDYRTKPNFSEEVCMDDTGHYRKAQDSHFPSREKIGNRRLVSGLYMIINNGSVYKRIASTIRPEHQVLGIDGMFQTMQALYASYEHQHGSSDFSAEYKDT